MSVIEFIPGIWPRTLKPESRKLLKDIFQAQEISKFMNWIDLVGYTPDPDDPEPWPWPGPRPWWHRGLGDPNSQPDLPNVLQGELLMEAIIRSSGNKESSSFIDAIRREGIVQEALKELSVRLADAQKSIELQMESLEVEN